MSLSVEIKSTSIKINCHCTHTFVALAEVEMASIRPQAIVGHMAMSLPMTSAELQVWHCASVLPALESKIEGWVGSSDGFTDLLKCEMVEVQHNES